MSLFLKYCLYVINKKQSSQFILFRENREIFLAKELTCVNRQRNGLWDLAFLSQAAIASLASQDWQPSLLLLISSQG